MNLSLSFAKKLQRMMEGEAIPSSSMKGEEVDYLLSEGIITARVNKSRVSYTLLNRSLLDVYLSSSCGTDNLAEWIEAMEKENLSRSELVAVAGDSKVRRVRSFKGFLVNSYEPVFSVLNGEPFTVSPLDGSFVFVYDFESFVIPADVVIVGIENPENLRYISLQRSLFDGRKTLFVSRYPQSQSKDLMTWLLSIPNSYLHFGDFDLAGIHIYLTEFYSKLGNRAQFLIPEGIENRIKKGSRKCYDEQYLKYRNMTVTDIRLTSLVDMIHRYRKGYEQEGFIGDIHRCVDVKSTHSL